MPKRPPDTPDLFEWQPDPDRLAISTFDHPAGYPEGEPLPVPKLVVLNYSGGRQSAALLWMVIRGDIPRPDHFVAINADPGMENSETYRYNAMMAKECECAGIELHLSVPGPNLLDDLRDVPNRKAIFRIDNPPYWTPPRKAGNKRGQLMQKCTKYYKILPMNRMVRKILARDFGIGERSSSLGRNIVEKWIGFHYDELPRIKAPDQRYVYFRYPLVQMKLGEEAVNEYYRHHGLPIPPRSVCNACFANGLASLKEMHDHRPEDWAQAVEIDEIIRHGFRGAMVEEDAFVSETCRPLKELAEGGFKFGAPGDQEKWSCDSGYCFV